MTRHATPHPHVYLCHFTLDNNISQGGGRTKICCKRIAVTTPTYTCNSVCILRKYSGEYTSSEHGGGGGMAAASFAHIPGTWYHSSRSLPAPQHAFKGTSPSMQLVRVCVVIYIIWLFYYVSTNSRDFPPYYHGPVKKGVLHSTALPTYRSTNQG